MLNTSAMWSDVTVIQSDKMGPRKLVDLEDLTL
jgi:hypothetical protein